MVLPLSLQENLMYLLYLPRSLKALTLMIITSALKFSHLHIATISSNTAIIVDKAANDINKKNIKPHILPNASVGIKFYLVPNISLVNQSGIGEAIFAAMTHAFFTLSIGIGAMEIFGSYLDKKRSLTGEAVSIVLLDTFVALMAGFIIIPACFAYGVNPVSERFLSR